MLLFPWSIGLHRRRAARFNTAMPDLTRRRHPRRSQLSSGRARCFCGAAINIAGTGRPAACMLYFYAVQLLDVAQTSSKRTRCAKSHETDRRPPFLRSGGRRPEAARDRARLAGDSDVGQYADMGPTNTAFLQAGGSVGEYAACYRKTLV
jgi:hypothetical protein